MIRSFAQVFSRSVSRTGLLLKLSAALCVGIILLGAAFNSPPTVRADGAGSTTLNALQQAVIPPRDRVDLARRYLQVVTLPPPSSATPFAVGDALTFTALNLDETRTFSVPAVLWYATPHVYMWFEKGYTPDRDSVRRSALRFEREIYPRVRELFGAEQSPGIDGDVHLFVLHARDLGRTVAGYFSSDSELPAVVAPRSNERQMFFMNLDTMRRQIGTDYYDGVLAHEFQHMVHANHDPNEDTWLNEGFSELAASLAVPDGFSGGFAKAFLGAPNTQLNFWDATSNAGPHYGASYLFSAYLYDRYGAEAIRAIVANPLNGFEGIDATLQALVTDASAAATVVPAVELFTQWSLANLLDDPQVAGGRFTYPALRTLDLPSPRLTPAVIGKAQTLSLNQFGTTYLAIDQPGMYTFSVTAKPTIPLIPTTAHSGDLLWWSNRSDQSDSHLTRTFDLRTLSQATLTFWGWFGIEKNWDYGYVAVSTDEGATWQALAAAEGSTDSTFNNPYGAAFTGFSAGTTLEQAQWRPYRVDLSRFAGKQILVRFEYITDDAYTLPGWAIDDIAIPELGYRSDAESGDDGWQAAGWVRIDNVLPQRYVITCVRYYAGSAPTVERWVAPQADLADLANGLANSQWNISVGGEITRAVIVISAVTEFTTEPATLTYTLNTTAASPSPTKGP